MPRKARAQAVIGLTIDRPRTTSNTGQWRCRINGFKEPFFGSTLRAACLQAVQALESQMEEQALHRPAAKAMAGTPGRRRVATRRKRVAEPSIPSLV
jgi:hypothetical protein